MMHTHTAYNTITLNGQQIHLPTCNFTALKEQNKESWWQDICSFLEAFADERETIEVQTSGSTGTPKKLAIEKYKFLASAKKTVAFFDLNKQSTGLLCLSAKYIAGQMMLVRALVSGMQLYGVAPEGNPVQQLATPIDFTAMVPLQVEQALKVPHFSRIKQVIIGGGPVNPQLQQALKQTKVKAYETFGMTETLSHIALRQITPETQAHFRALPGVELSLGKQEELVIAVPAMQLHALRTNDIVSLESATTFRWLGRLDFVINSGGLKLSPETLEKEIAPFIDLPFCISSLPDARLGEKVVLVVQDTVADEASLLQELKAMLTPYHAPRALVYLPALPLTETGKLNRPAIKKAIQQLG